MRPRLPLIGKQSNMSLQIHALPMLKTNKCSPFFPCSKHANDEACVDVNVIVTVQNAIVEFVN